MRILFCNKYNYPFSGTEVYLFELMDLLRSRGHEVALFSMAAEPTETGPDRQLVSHIDFKRSAGAWQQAQQVGHALYSTEARGKIRAMIHSFRPDVAHVRNIYHHLSPSILWELKVQQIPVLYHINDFKLLCPSYNLLKQGESCEACKGGAFWHVLTADCYPGKAARAVLAAEAYLHRWLETYEKCVDLFLAPSQFVRSKFVEHGWDGNRFDVLPHFQQAQENPQSPPKDGPLLFFGRLSAEKGVGDLLHAMKALPHIRLVIAGDGPQRAELQQLAGSLRLSNVEFVGHLATAERDALIRQSLCTLMPSHAYETFGKTILESYAQGRAVIASDTGSRRELVHHGKTGLLYRCADVNELVSAIHMFVSDVRLAESMGHAGRELVRTHYTPETHYEKLLRLYENLRTQPKTSTRSQSSMRKLTLSAFRRNASRPADRDFAAAPEKRRLSIAFIGGRGVISKYSGIETYYEEVGQRLAAMGHDVTVYCRNHFTPEVAEHNGMHLVRLPTIRSKHLETVVHTLLSTAHVLTHRYDVVHYHALGPALFSFLPRLAGMKSAVTVQGLDWQRKKWGRLASAVLRMGERASARFPNATMVVSRTLQRHYRESHHVEAAYVPNGGLLRARSAPRKVLEWGLEPGRYILFLGRFSPEKNCHLLVEAFEQIQSRIPNDVKLVLAGASSYCDAYGRELKKHAGDRILMLDWVSGEALDELLTNAMIFVLPSDLEGLSLALLDAMGAGLCVLASDIPENREAVEGAGFLFSQGDVADLAERLCFLIANPAAREAAGRTARVRIAAEYQWQAIAEEIEKAYFSMAHRQAEAAPAKKPSARVASILPGGTTERKVV
ncbi:MAG TPA: glycosyltransferase family 4 protein [Candidatus Sulfotelmatobacter sp.]|jgi:glycosyltransferase involved in cell wall biosynthesis